MSDPDYERWVALREYLHNVAFEMRGDAQVSAWVKAWTHQIDDKLTISGQSYRVCSTCDRGEHHCPGCGADVRHGEIACDECSDRAPRSRDIQVNERVEKRMERYRQAHEVLGQGALPADVEADALAALAEEVKQEREIFVSQLVSGDSVYSPSTKTWHEVRRATSGQLYFRRDERWMPVDFAADVKFLTRRGEAGAAAGLLFDAFGGEVIEG